MKNEASLHFLFYDPPSSLRYNAPKQSRDEILLLRHSEQDHV